MVAWVETALLVVLAGLEAGEMVLVALVVLAVLLDQCTLVVPLDLTLWLQCLLILSMQQMQ